MSKCVACQSKSAQSGRSREGRERGGAVGLGSRGAAERPWEDGVHTGPGTWPHVWGQEPVCASARVCGRVHGAGRGRPAVWPGAAGGNRGSQQGVGGQGRPCWGSDSQEGQGCPSCGPSTASNQGTRPPSVQAGCPPHLPLPWGAVGCPSSLIGQLGQVIPQSNAQFSLASLVTAAREY